MSSSIDLIDPVCGRDVERGEVVAAVRYRRFTYYFDSRACAERFRREPDRYLELEPFVMVPEPGPLKDQPLSGRSSFPAGGTSR